MVKDKVIIILGSGKDEEFSDSLCEGLRKLGVKYERRVASAHKTPKKLLKILKEISWETDILYALNTDEKFNIAKSGVKEKSREYKCSSLNDYEKLPEQKKAVIPEWFLHFLRIIEATKIKKVADHVGMIKRGVGFHIEQALRDEFLRMDKEKAKQVSST